MEPDVDPDLLALGAMIRQLLEQVARIKNPDNPKAELAQMRQNILEDIARTDTDRFRNGKQIRSTMFDAVLRLLPIDGDADSRN